MKAIPTDGELRQLLLRQLSAEATDEIEDRLVLDDSIAERLLHQQYELLDDYAFGRLTQDERGAVEKYLLRTRAERDRIYVAEGLMRAAQQRKVSGSNSLRGFRVPAFRLVRRPVFVAALTVSLAVLTVVAVRLLYPDAPPREVQPGAQSAALGIPAAPLSPSTPASALYQLTLLADTTRSGEAVELSLPRGASGLRLQAQIQRPDAVGRYRLTLMDSDGRTLFAAPDLELRQADGVSYVQTLIPASAISLGQLRVQVYAQDDVGGAAYSFTWTLRMS